MNGKYCLKVVAKQAELDCPWLVTGTKMRKYLATTTQVIPYLLHNLGHFKKNCFTLHYIHQPLLSVSEMQKMCTEPSHIIMNMFYGFLGFRIIISSFVQVFCLLYYCNLLLVLSCEFNIRA
jgi:hypothetical protein